MLNLSAAGQGRGSDSLALGTDKPELLFFLNYKLLVTRGVDESVQAAPFHSAVLCFQPKLTAVRTEENIAR
jgi:hypothetical protein